MLPTLPLLAFCDLRCVSSVPHPLSFSLESRSGELFSLKLLCTSSQRARDAVYELDGQRRIEDR